MDGMLTKEIGDGREGIGVGVWDERDTGRERRQRDENINAKRKET